MAISDSVTVSMGELMSGVFKVMFFVICVVRLTSSTGKSMKPGRTIMSS